MFTCHLPTCIYSVCAGWEGDARCPAGALCLLLSQAAAAGRIRRGRGDRPHWRRVHRRPQQRAGLRHFRPTHSNRKPACLSRGINRVLPCLAGGDHPRDHAHPSTTPRDSCRCSSAPPIPPVLPPLPAASALRRGARSNRFDPGPICATGAGTPCIAASESGSRTERAGRSEAAILTLVKPMSGPAAQKRARARSRLAPRGRNGRRGAAAGGGGAETGRRQREGERRQIGRERR